MAAFTVPVWWLVVIGIRHPNLVKPPSTNENTAGEALLAEQLAAMRAHKNAYSKIAIFGLSACLISLFLSIFGDEWLVT